MKVMETFVGVGSFCLRKDLRKKLGLSPPKKSCLLIVAISIAEHIMQMGRVKACAVKELLLLPLEGVFRFIKF